MGLPEDNVVRTTICSELVSISLYSPGNNRLGNSLFIAWKIYTKVLNDNTINTFYVLKEF